MIGGMHRLLDARDKARLRRLTEAIELETGAEIAALVVRRANDVPALARAYFDHVGIGKHGHDNGVLVLVAMDNRAIHVEIGRGLGTVVRPEDAQRVIDFVIAPQFRHGRFGEGLVRGVEAIGHLVRRAETR
ncbi:MAG TPA: TPM domain-containing protein [bacterium]|nr:TPM domain-containing protein [bacterium]